MFVEAVTAWSLIVFKYFESRWSKATHSLAYQIETLPVEMMNS